MSEAEARKYQRFPVTWKARWRSSQLSRNTRVLNISEGGIRLSASMSLIEKLNPGTPMDLRIRVPELARWFDLRGTVKWTGTDKDSKFAMGLEFESQRCLDAAVIGYAQQVTPVPSPPL